jgi:hypothetical protein
MYLPGEQVGGTVGLELRVKSLCPELSLNPAGPGADDKTSQLGIPHS